MLLVAAEQASPGPVPADDPRFEFLKSLAGTWVVEPGPGEPGGGIVVFRVTAGGHAVEEREMMGTPMEMLTVYNMDGRDLRATHQVQAAISAVHATSASHDETDWREIAGLYRELFRLQPSWVVRLNEAVALSFAEGPQAGLDVLAEIDGIAAVATYQPHHAARADLLRRLGRGAEAALAYRRALELTQNEPERRFLKQRLSEVDSDWPSPGEVPTPG